MSDLGLLLNPLSQFPEQLPLRELIILVALSDSATPERARPIFSVQPIVAFRPHAERYAPIPRNSMALAGMCGIASRLFPLAYSSRKLRAVAVRSTLS